MEQVCVRLFLVPSLWWPCAQSYAWKQVKSFQASKRHPEVLAAIRTPFLLPSSTSLSVEASTGSSWTAASQASLTFHFDRFALPCAEQGPYVFCFIGKAGKSRKPQT
eukprot:g23405.t1